MAFSARVKHPIGTASEISALATFEQQNARKVAATVGGPMSTLGH
jgi:hypothetical protein